MFIKKWKCKTNKYNLGNLVKQGVSWKERWERGICGQKEIKRRMSHKLTHRAKTLGRRYWKMNFSCHYERRKERITYLPIYFFLSPRSLWSYRWRSMMEVIRETIKSFKICTNRTNTPPWISIKVWEAMASNNWFINLLDLTIFFHTGLSDGLNPQCVLLGFTVFP